MSAFTPWSAALGGALIGGAAVGLWWLNGRIAGVSGLAGGAIAPGEKGGGRVWRLLFLLGLVLGAAAWFAWPGQVPAVRTGMHPGLLVAAGLLVGYGTTMAGGCTSGHGVCGLGRLSPRSLVAVAVFLGVAIITTGITRHVLGWST
jgi:uncharacterized membrane protein YedE/YeeE